MLGALRLADVVRYDTDGKRNRYRLKHPVEVRSVIAALSRFVKGCRRSRPVKTGRFRNSGNMEVIHTS